jgi:Ricin-type beta-trefoil lectin domain-like
LYAHIRRLAIGGVAAVSLAFGFIPAAAGAATGSAGQKSLRQSASQVLPQNGDLLQIQNQYSSMCVNDYAYSTAAGHDMVQWQCNSNDANQNWIAEAQPNGSFTLVNEYSRLCLDDFGASSADGNPIDQWYCNADPDQYDQAEEWYIDYVSGPGVSGYQLWNVLSGESLTDYSYSLAEGNVIRQYHDDNYGKDEMWNVTILASS